MARQFSESTTNVIAPEGDVFTDAFTTMTTMIKFAIIDGTAGPGALYTEGGATNGFAIAYRNTPDQIHFATVIASTIVEIINTSDTYPSNENIWRTAVATYNAGAMELFIDGVSKVTGSNSTSIPAHANPAGIGNFVSVTFNSYKAFGGKLAEFARWDVVLNDGQIKGLAQGIDPREFRRNALRSYIPILGLSQFERDVVQPDNAEVTGTTVVEHPPIRKRAPFRRSLHTFVVEAAAGGPTAGSLSLSGVGI